jgi:2-keto-4-pentenoate hydratase/2-oxohepta-3-ene-1,7-dioic acid hydratase in catechol pathway
MTVRGDEDRSLRKSADTFTPIGPAIVTADEVPDPGELRLRLWLNGELRQNACTSDLVWGVPKLIEEYSEWLTLEPGDLVATGTPAGVGRVRPGDRITLTIERVGTLEMAVAP